MVIPLSDRLDEGGYWRTRTGCRRPEDGVPDLARMRVWLVVWFVVRFAPARDVDGTASVIAWREMGSSVGRPSCALAVLLFSRLVKVDGVVAVARVFEQLKTDLVCRLVRPWLQERGWVA